MGGIGGVEYGGGIRNRGVGCFIIFIVFLGLRWDLYLRQQAVL